MDRNTIIQELDSLAEDIVNHRESYDFEKAVNNLKKCKQKNRKI